VLLSNPAAIQHMMRRKIHSQPQSIAGTRASECCRVSRRIETMRNMRIPIFGVKQKLVDFGLSCIQASSAFHTFAPVREQSPNVLMACSSTRRRSLPQSRCNGERTKVGALWPNVLEDLGVWHLHCPLSRIGTSFSVIGSVPDGDALPARLVPSFRQDPAMRGSAGFPGCRPGPRSGARRSGNVILAGENPSGTRGASLRIHGEAAARTVNC